MDLFYTVNGFVNLHKGVCIWLTLSTLASRWLCRNDKLWLQTNFVLTAVLRHTVNIWSIFWLKMYIFLTCGKMESCPPDTLIKVGLAPYCLVFVRSHLCMSRFSSGFLFANIFRHFVKACEIQTCRPGHIQYIWCQHFEEKRFQISRLKMWMYSKMT